MLALLAERASGVPFHDLVRERVCAPAGMQDTEFLRSDELPGRAALGYLADESPRTNVFHLPVRGSGDGGIYSTVADFSSFWDALVDGRIVVQGDGRGARAGAQRRPAASRRYGLGFWLGAGNDVIALEGYDAGVSFRSVHDPVRRITHTVISNTSEGAWPLTRLLAEQLST